MLFVYRFNKMIPLFYNINSLPDGMIHPFPHPLSQHFILPSQLKSSSQASVHVMLLTSVVLSSITRGSSITGHTPALGFSTLHVSLQTVFRPLQMQDLHSVSNLSPIMYQLLSDLQPEI